MAYPSRMLKLARDALEAVGHLRVLGAGVVELGHPVGEFFHLVFERAQIVEHRHAFGEDGAAGERKAILRQVAEDVVSGG